MNESTLTALRGSIQHWENIRDGKEPAHHIGSNYCHLCHLFIDVQDEYGECAGCPVRDYTQIDGCQKTPFMAYHRKLRHGFDDEADRVAAAHAEVRFLKSLLPEGN